MKGNVVKAKHNGMMSEGSLRKNIGKLV